MSTNTKIQWVDATFNPWIGCTMVSEGCIHCYMGMSTPVRVLRAQGKDPFGKGAPRSRTSAATWRNPVKWNQGVICETCGRSFEQLTGRQKLCEPIAGDYCQHCKFGKYRGLRVFPSLCDWLDPEVPIEWLADFLQLIHDTPNLDWLLLTKRPENFHDSFDEVITRCLDNDDSTLGLWCCEWALEKLPPNNVWLGTSVENQAMADKRIPELLKIPARVRFLSVEPMLANVTFDPHWLGAGGRSGNNYQQPQIDWVIFGGESGPNARPCNVEWIRAGLRQCQAAGVPVFVKQLGGNAITNNVNADAWPDGLELAGQGEGFAACRVLLKDAKGGDPTEWPEDIRRREFPKSEDRER